MDVRVKVGFTFNTTEQLFEAHLLVHLPIEESEWPDINLCRLLRNPHKSIGGFPLKRWIGEYDEESRCKVLEYRLTSETLEGLEEKVEKELKDIERTLKEVYWENIKNQRMLPEKREYVIKLE